MKHILQFILRWLSQAVLRKYHPEVIGITGSVGKTSTKEAIFAVLAEKFRCCRNVKNYNNEIGLPLTILGMESGGRSIIKWLEIFLHGILLLLRRDKQYPEILILEMGADHPGDIFYLTNLAPCKVGVITAVAQAHTEFFKTVNQVAKEKQIIVTHLEKDATAILNADDEKVLAMKAKTEAETISFGFGEKAVVRAVDFNIIQEMDKEFLQTKGVNFKIQYGGAVVPVFLPEVVGTQHVYAALAAAAVGLSYGLNLVEISERLRFYNPPPSRMRLLPGMKFMTIIDDSYNSSPLAAVLALRILSEIKIMESGRRIAVLGDMLELGGYAFEAHQEVGTKVAELGIDLLIAVGERAKIVAEAARLRGMAEDKIVQFADSIEAGQFLQENIHAGDLILIKGSQGVRMEKIVVRLMAEPADVKKLVCRQDASWKNK
ncbi:MAG: UDP-N-acetylmuramoyl-tripeptide--D-alanyl-D-alanine ligase [Candidatus Magasanikbacteria bacterium]|nr:UDP-N-acetylmuramoyl-tripeptide--D-alanyl-D-alanine ligase [Candidatus Magasanikbacteria bacterium]